MPLSKEEWDRLVSRGRKEDEKVLPSGVVKGTGKATPNQSIVNRLRAAHAVSESGSVSTSADNKKKAQRLFGSMVDDSMTGTKLYSQAEETRDEYEKSLNEKSKEDFSKKLAEYEERFAQYEDKSYADAMGYMQDEDDYKKEIERNKYKSYEYAEMLGGNSPEEKEANRKAYEESLNKETTDVYGRRKADKDFRYYYSDQSREDMQKEVENLQKQYDEETDEYKKFAIEQQIGRANSFIESQYTADEVQAKIDEQQAIIDEYEKKYPNGELQAKSTLVSDEERAAYNEAKKNLSHYKDLLNVATVNDWDDDVYGLEDNDKSAYYAVYSWNQLLENDSKAELNTYEANDPLRQQMRDNYEAALDYLKSKYTDAEIQEMEEKFKYVADRDFTLQSSQKMAEDIAKATGLEKVGYIAALGLGTALDAYNAPLKMLDATMQALTGKPINVYDSTYSIANMNNAITEGIVSQTKNQKAWTMGLGIYCSLVQMGATMTAGIATGAEGISLFLMGNSAASQTVLDMAQKGASNDKIIASAIATGIAEALFEKVSIEGWIHPETFLKDARFLGDTAGIAMALFKQMGCEVSEELCTDIANEFTDYLINGGNSNAAMSIEAYKNMGYSQTQAEKMYMMDFGEQLGETALSSAIISAFMTPTSFASVDASIDADIRKVENLTGLNSEDAIQAIREYALSGEAAQATDNIVEWARDKVIEEKGPAYEQRKAENRERLKANYNEAQSSAYEHNGIEQTRATHALSEADLDEIADIATKRGIDVQFATFDQYGRLVDENGKVIFSGNNWKANGLYTNENGQRKVYINPQFDKNQTLAFLASHEMVHDMQGTSSYAKLRDMVLRYMDKKVSENGETFNMLERARETFGDLYANQFGNMSEEERTAAIEEEIIADFMGEMLGKDRVLSYVTNATQGWQKGFPRLVENIENFFRSKEDKIFNQYLKAFNDRYTGTETGIRYALKSSEPVKPQSDAWARNMTYDEVKAKHPNLFELNSDDNTAQNPTQIAGTVKTYDKIYDIIEQDDNFTKDSKILDASSGLGIGTAAGRERGLNVDDVEPYPSKNYSPKYTDYSAIEDKYDYIISNAVLNVLPQDLRDDAVFTMGELLKDGGKMYINVRGKDVLSNKSNVVLSEPMEVYVESTGSYQKGFTQKELVAYLEDALGDNYSVEPTKQFGAVSVVVTKEYGAISEMASANNDATSLKQKQLDIILENNPANDDYHTWIRTIDDIKTFQEAYDEWETEGYEQFTEDFTKEDMQKALSTGKITVYSSYPIKEGIFVSPSRMEAYYYSGDGKVYSKDVSLEDVAWIDEGQGQYAPLISTNNEDINKNTSSENTPTYTEEEYYHHGWARANDCLTPAEYEVLKKGIGALRRGDYFNKTDNGYIIPVYSNEPASENILVYTDGDFEDFSIDRIVYIHEYSDTFTDEIRKLIYENERRHTKKFQELIDDYRRTGVISEVTARSYAYDTYRNSRRNIEDNSGTNQGLQNRGGSSQDSEGSGNERYSKGSSSIEGLDGAFDEIRKKYGTPEQTETTEAESDISPVPENIYDRLTEDTATMNEVLPDVGDLDNLAETPRRPERLTGDLIENNTERPRERLVARMRRNGRFFATKLIDSASIFHDISNRYGSKTYDVFTAAKGSSSMANNAVGGYTMRNGEPVFTGNMVDMTGRIVGKSVAETTYKFQHADETFLNEHDVEGNNLKSKQLKHWNECQEYLVMLLNRDEIHRIGRARISGYNLSRTENIIGDFEAKYGTEYAEELRKVNRQVTDYILSLRVQSGMITQADAEEWIDAHPNYVPTLRFDGTDDFADIDMSAGKQGLYGEQRKRASGGGRKLIPLDEAYATQINSAMRFGQRNIFFSNMLSDATQHEELGQHIRVLNTLESAYNMTQAQLLGQYNDRANTYVAFTKDGGAVVFEVDNIVQTAVKDLTNPMLEIEEYLEGWQNVNAFWRSLVTNKNPLFTISNAFRDLGQALLMSDSPTTYIKNYARAWQEMVNDTELYKQFEASGVMSSSISGGMKSAQRNNWLDNVGEWVEMMPRFSAYLTAIDQYGNNYEGRLRAQFEAKDITTNFSQGGDWTKALNRNGFNFLNANVQGLLQIGRKITDPIRNQNLSRNQKIQRIGGFFIRGLVLGMTPYLLNALAYKDDKDYEELADSIKTQYMLFKKSDGTFIRIPYGRALVISTTLANIMMNAADGEKIDVSESLKTVWDNIGVAEPSGLWTPIVDAYNNKTWYGGTLVNQTLSERETKDQYDETTDDFSKILGRVFNISPKKVNYVLDQWSGFVGDFVLPMITDKYKSDNPLDYAVAPFRQRFTTDPVTNNDLYDTYNGMFTDVKKKAATDGGYYGAEQYFYSQSKEINSIWTQIHDVQRYKSLSESEKEALQQKYMSYGSLDTYKVRQQIIRDMRKAINGIQRNTIENYDYIISASQKYPITDDMNFTEKKLATFKMNSDIFGGEYALRQYGGDTWDDAQLANTCGISFDTYAQYLTSTAGMKADKDANGKTISGSLKKKKWEALSSMNLSDGERAFIFSMEYKITQKTSYYDTEALQKALQDYIDSLNLTDEEKKYLKKELIS